MKENGKAMEKGTLDSGSLEHKTFGPETQHINPPHNTVDQRYDGDNN